MQKTQRKPFFFSPALLSRPRNGWNVETRALLIFSIAFCVRLAFILTLEERLYWPDETDFNSIALGLLDGQGYQSEPFRANPVLPFFLAAIYKVFGYGYLAPRIIQSVLGALTACIVFAMANSLFGRRVAFLAGFGTALYPSLIYVSGFFYVSALETFLLALSIYLLLLSTQRRSLTFLLLSGISIGLTALCRPAAITLLPFVVFFVFVAFEGSGKRKILYATGLIIITFLTILPWSIRNYFLYDQFVLVSTGSGLFLWRGNNELARGDSDDRYLDPGEGEVWATRLNDLTPERRSALSQQYDTVKRDLKTLGPVDHDRYLQRLALAYMAEHPIRSIELFFQKISTIYTAFTPVRAEHRDFISSKKRLAFSLLFYPTLLLATIGGLYGLRDWRWCILIYSPILALTLGYGLLTAATRFRIPLEPYIIILASYGCAMVWDLMRSALRNHAIKSILASPGRIGRRV